MEEAIFFSREQLAKSGDEFGRVTGSAVLASSGPSPESLLSALQRTGPPHDKPGPGARSVCKMPAVAQARGERGSSRTQEDDKSQALSGEENSSKGQALRGEADLGLLTMRGESSYTLYLEELTQKDT